MKLRKIVSLTAGLSFVFVLLTSIILYIVPQGRVAYWADWRLWGLSKTDWGNIHINVGFLFLTTLFLHIYYNWKQILAYMKNKTRRLKVFTPDLNAALVLTVLVVVGTYAMAPPFRWVLDLNESIKQAAAKKYGEPPYGHAELSTLKSFSKKTQIDLHKGRQSLVEAGIRLESENQTIKDIAHKNRLSPQQIYLLMKPEQATGEKTTKLPDFPPPGTGNRTLFDFCQAHDLNIERILKGLDGLSIKASAGETIKGIALANQRSPIDIYEAIKEIR